MRAPFWNIFDRRTDDPRKRGPKSDLMTNFNQKSDLMTNLIRYFSFLPSNLSIYAFNLHFAKKLLPKSKSCLRLLEEEKVAKIAKSCSEVDEHNREMPRSNSNTISWSVKYRICLSDI